MPSIINRIQSGWNAFLGRDPTAVYSPREIGIGSSYRPDRARFFGSGDRNIIAAVINRIGIDASGVDIKHVRLEDDRYVETVNSTLNTALTIDANIDQTGRAFIQDVVESMCEDGCVAIVPTDTTTNPYKGSYDIQELRVGKVVEWYPKHVKVEVYNENSGKRETLLLPKAMVGLPQNPLYSVMNEPNSTLQRLKRTLANLDILDDRNASGKLDLIIQLPYVVKSEARKKQAEARRKEIEMQLIGSKYGVAYTDGTERVVQLNRPIENNYWTQAKELTSMLYNQLGLTESVFDGSADEKTMTNYYERTIKPILLAITEEMERKFLTKTARSQGQAIRFFRDPFKWATIEGFATIAETLTRNEIASPNEMRTAIGWKPSGDPASDELRNRNINQEAAMMPQGHQDPNTVYGNQNGVDEVPQQPSNENLSDKEIEDLLTMLQDEMNDLNRIKEERQTGDDDG